MVLPCSFSGAGSHWELPLPLSPLPLLPLHPSLLGSGFATPLHPDVWFSAHLHQSVGTGVYVILGGVGFFWEGSHAILGEDGTPFLGPRFV